MSGIDNPANIGTRAIKIAQLKGIDNKWPEQMNLEFTSEEQKEQKAFNSTKKKRSHSFNWNDLAISTDW